MLKMNSDSVTCEHSSLTIAECEGSPGQRPFRRAGGMLFGLMSPHHQLDGLEVGEETP